MLGKLYQMARFESKELIYHQLLRIFRMAVFFCEEEEEESKQISTAWAF